MQYFRVYSPVAFPKVRAGTVAAALSRHQLFNHAVPRRPAPRGSPSCASHLAVGHLLPRHTALPAPVCVQKTDSNGDYVRKWLPQFRDFPREFIYEPWKAPKAVQQRHGVVVGETYPARVVVHEEASKANMTRMAAAFDANKALPHGAAVPAALAAAPGASGVGATQMGSEPGAHAAATASMTALGQYPYGSTGAPHALPLAALSGTAAAPAGDAAAGGSGGSSGGGGGARGSHPGSITSYLVPPPPPAQPSAAAAPAAAASAAAAGVRAAGGVGPARQTGPGRPAAGGGGSGGGGGGGKVDIDLTLDSSSDGGGGGGAPAAKKRRAAAAVQTKLPGAPAAGKR